VTAKYKHVSETSSGTTDSFSDPLSVQEGRAIHFSAVGTYVGQVAFQIRFRFEKADDWRTLTRAELVPAANAEFEDGQFRAAVDCQIRVGTTAMTSGSVLTEGRISRERVL